MIITSDLNIATRKLTVVPPQKALTKTVVGPGNCTATELAEYRVTEYYHETGLTNEEQIQFDADKANVTWVYWVGGGLMDGEGKPHVIIGAGGEGNNTKVLVHDKHDVTSDFTQTKIASDFQDAIEEHGLLYAKAEVVEENGKKINKLTLKFSKWLDGYEVFVEAYRGSLDHNPQKSWVHKTNVTTYPEVTNAYWIDSQGKRITSVGYEHEISLCVETLGLNGEIMKLGLFDYDGPFNPDDAIPWGTGETQRVFQISQRRHLQAYSVAAQDSELYDNAQSWVDGDLDVYVNIELDDYSGNAVLEDEYANIAFLENAKATPYLATKDEVLLEGETYIQYNKIDTVYPGMIAYLVAQTTNLSGTVTFSVTEETNLLLDNPTDKLPLLFNGVRQNTFEATIENGYAVALVQFEDEGEEWNNILDNESEEGLESKLIINAQASNEVYSSNPVSFKSSTLRYVISADGIIKYSRKESKRARYIFTDNQGEVHFLLTRDFTTIDWVEKDKKGRLTQNYIYKKDKVNLVEVKQGDAYNSGSVKFKILKLDTTSRKYIDSDCFACLLAAMIENGIEDLKFNGFSTVQGKSGNSQSHWNGMVGDLGYLNVNKNATATWLSNSSAAFSNTPNWSHNSDFDYDRQVLFNNSLYKYGFSKFKRLNNGTVVKMLSENFVRTVNGANKTLLLPHTSHYREVSFGVFHFHHLHLQGLDVSFFTIKK